MYKVIHKWRCFSYAWTGEHNTIKTAILTKLVCGFSSTPIKISTDFCFSFQKTDTENACEKQRRAKTTLKKRKSKIGRLTFPISNISNAFDSTQGYTAFKRKTHERSEC